VVSFMPQTFYAQGKSSQYPLDRRLGGPRTGLDDMENREILTLPGLELRPLGSPACSQTLYRPHYPSFCHLLIGTDKCHAFPLQCLCLGYQIMALYQIFVESFVYSCFPILHYSPFVYRHSATLREAKVNILGLLCPLFEIKYNYVPHTREHLCECACMRL
jgi:hypothetical protein